MTNLALRDEQVYHCIMRFVNDSAPEFPLVFIADVFCILTRTTTMIEVCGSLGHSHRHHDQGFSA